MLREISKYSSKERDQLCQFSPAIKRYLSLTQKAPQSFGDEIRIQRMTHWCKAAAATILNTTHPREICSYWSDQSIQLLKKTWEYHKLNKEQVSLFALGKLGAGELNLSSDVDLLVIGDPSATSSVRKFSNELAEVTEFGFAFRVDFDLRPGGKFSPLIQTPGQFMNHYWTHGETWERLALIRLLPITGDNDIRAEVQGVAEKFIYRKFLDFRLLDNLSHLRKKIHDQISDQDIHLKLGTGGIRDIELFIHALLVIHGGKAPQIKTRSTDEAIDRLIAHDIFEAEKLERLKNIYWELRRAENLVQSIGDQQTHTLYLNNISIDHKKISKDMEASDSIVSEILGQVEVVESTIPRDLNDQKQWLKTKGFSENSYEKVWPELISRPTKSINFNRDENIRLQTLETFVEELAKIESGKDLGLALLNDFFKSIRSKASFYTLLLLEPRLIKDLSRLFSVTPYLGHIIATRPELLDSFLFRVTESFSHDFDSMLEEMAEQRRVMEIIAANEFLDTLNIEQLGQALSFQADHICLSLLKRLKDEFNSEPIDILMLGKWGGQELGFRSDLDFIFVSEKSPSENEFKVAKRFTKRLTEVNRAGSIYSIDLRLRPSGKAGLLITSMESLLNYLKNEALPWERQSYLKCRFLSGGSTEEIRKALISKPLSPEDLTGLSEIRRKLRENHVKGSNDLKYSAGGIIDIEFAYQIHFLNLQKYCNSANTLKQIQWVGKKSNISSVHRQVAADYLELRKFEQLIKLVSQKNQTQLTLDDETIRRISHILDEKPEELNSRIEGLFERVDDCLQKIDPIKKTK